VTGRIAPPPPPARGIGAHRGASATHPENTLAAFREAVRLGAAMVELDLRRSADGQVVVMHDRTVDRTTNGKGKVSKLKLARLRRLDAGRHRGDGFAGERIPTLAEVLDWAPPGVWLNLQIKGHATFLATDAARQVAARGMLRRALLACGNLAARDARTVNPALLICNLARQETREAYIHHAAATRADFVQLHHLRGLPEPELVALAHASGLRVIYFDDAEKPEPAAAWAAGVDFVLVDDVASALVAIPEARPPGLSSRP